MAANRPTTRRRSARHAFEDDDAPTAKRPKTEVNGAGRRTNGATKKAAKTEANVVIAYDEDDDGFQFTRRTSRRTTKSHLAPEPIPEEPAQPAPSRRKKDSVAAPGSEAPAAKNPRRSTRLSADKEQLEAHADVRKSQSKSTKKTAAPEKKKQATPAPEPQLEKKIALNGVETPKANELQVAKKRDGGATKIMLPFADTPVITRNKEMRKGTKEGHRRSSTGLRGRRASSLIDSGLSNALPHSELEVRDYYKYIEQSLPEPRRMKQLLTWSGSRALPEKPSGDVKNVNAIMAARAIQQELIDDFANKPDITDWFSREDAAPAPVVKKPNPQNEKNRLTLQQLEEEVKRLEDEKAAWDALVSIPGSMPPPPPPLIHTPKPALSDVDPSVLDPSQASILAALQLPQSADPSSDTHPPSSTFTFTTPSALQAHLTKLSQSLEPHINLFADGVHKIEQYRSTAERVADRVLGTAAQRLEERDKEGKEKVGSEGIGVGDVLRSLAGVLKDS
ncbi:Mis12-Mtw1 protein family-domain-containing protein [Massariosphaeria phaeospora]|uniref:Mis12-Mtw1 protein family-domain-containing protein n=1 Tax=Massariosphaeria phaeospora TaxID=100035 RepID=A0A7C8MAY2_9PLEO|nr:Mis12-Mtw1 protein family-domain-containing protein [Massariosphaeria phaeospora]